MGQKQKGRLWIKLTKFKNMWPTLDDMDKIGQYGQNWTLDHMDKIGHYGHNWTKLDNVDEIYTKS